MAMGAFVLHKDLLWGEVQYPSRESRPEEALSAAKRRFKGPDSAADRFYAKTWDIYAYPQGPHR
jgi:hypothetical protein